MKTTLKTFVKRHYGILATCLFDLFLLWVILRFVLGGWEQAVRLLPSKGPAVWGELFVLVFLTLVKSNFRNDIPLFLSACLLAYWGEWWGTHSGIWAYFGTNSLPSYVVITWGVCLLTVFHLHLLLRGKEDRKSGKYLPWIQKLSLLALPFIALALTWKGLVHINWMKVVDFHMIAGTCFACFVIFKNFDLNETFWIFISGTLLGGLYEYMGTAMGNWKYATGQGMPLLIAPLWGLACVVMVKLGTFVRDGFTVLTRKFCST